MNKQLISHFKKNKFTYFFLTVIFILSVYIFYPVTNIAFGEWDWMELEYSLKDIPENIAKTAFWLKFYLFDPYGTTYALIGITKLIFKTSMSGYYLMNVSLRILSSTSLYFLASWWSGKKSIGFITGIFFVIAVPGIENTTWVVQFVAYIAVILLSISLYFWKRFHNHPNSKNLKLSATFFGLAIFISHIRLHALPLILLFEEIYFHILGVKNRLDINIKISHLLILAAVFLTLYFSSSSVHINSQILKTISPIIIIKSLISGYPPIIHSFFLFIGNLIFPSRVIDLLNPYTKTFFDFSNLDKITLIISTICSILFFVNLLKKRYVQAYITLLAVIYPLSLYYNKDNLGWNQFQLASASIGGAIFFLIIAFINHLRETVPKEKELLLLGMAITLSHLIFPWMAFPQFEANVQAAYPTDHRYYTIPLVGMSLIWGIIFSYFWKLFLDCIPSTLNLSKKVFALLLKGFFSLITVYFLIILFISQGLATQDTIIRRTYNFDKTSYIQLCNMIKPIFASLDDKHKDRVVYIEGNLSEKDKSIVIYLLRHYLINELGYGRPGNKYNVTFIIDKQSVKRLFEKDTGLYQQYNLPSSFSKKDFMAFRINESGLKDIKQEILKEIKYTD